MCDMDGARQMIRRTWLEDTLAQRGLSREALAQFLGVTVGSVSHWINGRAVPGGPTRKLLAFYLSLSEDAVARGFEDGNEGKTASEDAALEGAA